MLKNHSFSKVKGANNQPIRGLWQRSGKYLARLSINGAVKWIPLSGATLTEARTELARLQLERTDNNLRHIGRAPLFGAYVETYLERLKTSGKKHATFMSERAHLRRWVKALASLPVDKIRPSHITAHLHSVKLSGLSGRTCNLALVVLRNVIKAARLDGFLKVSPAAEIPRQKTISRARSLYLPADIDTICAASHNATFNAVQFSDFLRLLSLCGAREQETLRLSWEHVDFARGLLTIGADGNSKNRETRRVDFNPELAAHLRDMLSRREPESPWLFPSLKSPLRASRSLRHSLILTRLILPENLRPFSFHDCRHFFISHAVMAGIDFLTIARWVGHKDGGILIGRIYGHLSSAHTRAQAARLSFNPPPASPLDPGQAFLPLVAA